MGAEKYGGCDINKSSKNVIVTLSKVLCSMLVIGGIVSIIFYIRFLINSSHDDPSPSFTLDDVKLYAFNFSAASSTLTSKLQITLLSKNYDYDKGVDWRPDVPFHFDQIDVYASYRKQQITLPTAIPPMDLDSPDTTVWSPFLNGTEVPVSPDLAAFLVEDMTVGTMLINVEVTGQLSVKQHSRIFRNRLKVNCMAYIMFGNKNDSNIIGWAVKQAKQPFVEGCLVDVF